MTLNEKKKSSFKMPHVFIIMMIIMLIVVAVSYIVPNGEFQREVDPNTGMTIVDPNTFQYIENENPIGFMDYFKAIYSGVVQGATIMASLLICSGILGFLESTGSFAAGIHKLLENVKGKELSMVIMLYVLFTLFGVLGFGEAAYPFYGIATAVVMALGYDRLAGAAMVITGSTVGFACGMLNVFTTGVSQQLLGLPMFSGIEFRFVALIVFFIVGLIGIIWYCKMIKKNPEKSYVYDEFSKQADQDASALIGERVPLDGRRIAALVGFLIIICIQAYACMKLGWGLGEISGLYVIFAVILAVIFRIGPTETCNRIVAGAARVLGPALAIGLARSVMILLEQGKIMDTMVHFMGDVLQGKSPMITLLLIYLFVTLFNFFVLSGSGKAVMMMPILNPLSELLGINKQVMVLTYQFGDGLTNNFWPGGGVVACSLCGIDYGAWMKFALRVFPFLLLSAYILIVIADMINLGPF